MHDLKGRNALLTGATGGLGPHIGYALVERGVNLVVTSSPRSTERLAAVADHLARPDVRAIPLTADLTMETDRRKLVAQTTEQLGPIDILVNNAGVENPGQFTRLDKECLVQTVDTNITATLHLSMLVLDGMLARGSGHVVVLSSMAGKVPVPYTAIYSTTKAALIAWTEALRVELEGTGVSISAVCPTFCSEAGMFARHAAKGMKAHWLAGTVPPGAVATAVVRAIEEDLAEVLVTAYPTRPFLGLRALFPGLLRKIGKITGFYDSLHVYEELRGAEEAVDEGKEHPLPAHCDPPERFGDLQVRRIP